TTGSRRGGLETPSPRSAARAHLAPQLGVEAEVFPEVLLLPQALADLLGRVDHRVVADRLVHLVEGVLVRDRVADAVADPRPDLPRAPLHELAPPEQRLLRLGEVLRVRRVDVAALREESGGDPVAAFLQEVRVALRAVRRKDPPRVDVALDLVGSPRDPHRP